VRDLAKSGFALRVAAGFGRAAAGCLSWGSGYGWENSGVLSDAVLARWCGDTLGSAPVGVPFRRQHLSQVVAVELADGRGVVVKVRPAQERVAGCVAVQAALARAGFPCPVAVAGPGWHRYRPVPSGSADAADECFTDPAFLSGA
jgi:hypothetical protein